MDHAANLVQVDKKLVLDHALIQHQNTMELLVHEARHKLDHATHKTVQVRRSFYTFSMSKFLLTLCSSEKLPADFQVDVVTILHCFSFLESMLTVLILNNIV